MNIKKSIILSIIGFSLFFVFWAAWSGTPYGQKYNFNRLLIPDDSTTKQTKSRRPTYTPEDRLGDKYNNPTQKSPLELKDPDNITEEVEIDSATGNYIVTEKVGDMEYRTQTYLTFEEYYKYKNRQMLRDYYQKKGADPMATDPKLNKPGQPFGFTKHIKGLEGPFGSNYVDIRPSGLVVLDFAGRWQRVNNPTLPIKQQRNGLFDFDEQISMNVVGKIGEKLKLTVNWDTKAAFEFQNSVKIQYTAFEEDIIQGIEVGRVNMPLNSSLMTGPQNLFGFKTKLQFGRMTVTAVAARQDGKLDEIVIGGGGQGRTFQIKADQYEPYRHFFLSQFFRANYEKSLKSSPTVLSGVQVTRVEVYITNRNNTTANLRNVVGYMDLGEGDSLYRPDLKKTGNNDHAAYNSINKLYDTTGAAAASVTRYRDPATLASDLQTYINPVCNCSFSDGSDYTYLKSARKLSNSEFTFNPSLGYITLQTRIREDEALLVAYEYSYEGKIYKVGELNEDYATLPATDMVIAKMIKPPLVKTRLPTWDLMMKNIYQLGVTQLQRDNFQFRIIYKDDASGADIPNLQEGTNTQNVPLLRLTGLDLLNPNNDPSPDGNFDYVEGVTVDSKNGRVIFPVLEPFGSNLEKYFLPSEASLKQKYVFSELYDSTLSDAQQMASKDKYFFNGRYTAGTASEIILPGINVAQGSVIVIAGSNQLQEGVDYTVDYNLGRIRIINESVLASGQEIRIRFEKQDLFNFRRKSFLGTRLDYKVNDNILLGGTLLHSNEAPNITRVNIGDEPAANTIWGLDASVKQDSRLLTRAVDLLPVVSTKAKSSINFQGEFAQFLPGYNKIIDKNGNGDGGIAFIDDFEGTKTPYDLTRSPMTWRVASTPQRFPEAAIKDTSLTFSKYRAKLAWYNIDNLFYRSNNGLPGYLAQVNNHFERSVTQQELYPNQDVNVAVTNIPTLDLAYYPRERGTFNYNTDLTADGKLKDSTRNWAGMTKDLRNDVDFDNANIQYIEFWLMSPYQKEEDPAFNNGKGKTTTVDGKPFDQTNSGKLYFNLGSISEDVLPDQVQSFENGLPINDADTSSIDTTAWGVVTNKQFITNAFDNSANSRSKQDVGLDGLDDAGEFAFFKNFTTAIEGKSFTQAQKDNILKDVSADNFQYYLGQDQDDAEASILERYKNFQRTQNNSPLNSGASFTPSNSNYPDNEDLNGDNTLNTLEEYYEYKVDIDPAKLVVGQNYIVSKNQADVTLPDGTRTKVDWYQFRIPIRTPDSIVGDIQGYKTIKWMRTYVTGFKSPVVLRMAQFQLVANQWRNYQLDDLDQGNGLQISPRSDLTALDISVVNIEENGGGNQDSTSTYVLPPGFNRDYDATSVTTRRTNEQSLRECITGLEDGYSKAAYKGVNLNLMNYSQINMFLHAESKQTGINNKDAVAFLRFGTDYVNNYYEIEVPLYLTTPITSADPNEVWRSENEIIIAISDLINTKVARNAANASPQERFANPNYSNPNGQKLYVVGNPDMSAVVTIMIGLRNPYGGNKNPLNFCIWADELRASGFVTHSSYAYAGKLNMNLADLGQLNSSIRFTSAGFGSLDQKVSQRERANTLEYGINTTLNMEKFIPGKTGIKLPMYIGYNRKAIAPQYDPLNPDVSLAQSVNNSEDPSGYKKMIIDQTATRAINFTNVQKVKVKPNAKKHIYDVENLTLSLGYTETKRTSFEIKDYTNTNYKGGLGYNYTSQAKPITPFKSMTAKGGMAPLLKDFNFSLMPSQLGFRGDLNRTLTKTQYYQSGPLTPGQVANYQKSFTFTRTYNMMWNLTKSINTTYTADAYAIIDEPNREPGGKEYSDSILSNLKNFGRMKTFNQNININYKLPLDKIKVLNWTSMDYTYGAGYSWASGALIQRDTLGNSIQNKQNNTVNAKVDLDKLYSKSKFLTEMNKPKPPLLKPDPKDTTKKLPPPNRTVLKAFFKTLMMVRNANVSYTSARTTDMAGYMEVPKYIGLSNWGTAGTMMPFVFGSQDPNFRYRAAEEGMVSTSRSLLSPYRQTVTNTINAKVNVEPLKDFKIVLESKVSIGSIYEEQFRIDTTGTHFVSDNPRKSGNYSVSTITILTAFDKHVGGSIDPNSSSHFEDYTNYRQIMADRLNASTGQTYELNSQSVLMPAFLAAYTGKDPNKTNLNGVAKIPLPGWQLDYAGLAKIAFLKKKFQSITLSHKYSSTYTVGSYISSLEYNSSYITPDGNFYNSNQIPTALNSSGQIIPLYVLNGVSINEAFAPFIGFNARTKNKVSYKLTYARTRMLNMSLTNAQLTESYNNSIQIGIGFARSNVPIPKFFTRGQKINLKNELNIQINFTINDMITYQRKFYESATVTAGNTNVQFKPTVSYNISQRVTMQLYFERTINSPKISSSYRRATTAIGLQIRFTLS